MNTNEIVKFHNNLNKIPFDTLNEIERNLVMSMLVQVKEKGSDVIKYNLTDIRKAIPNNITNEDLKKVILGLQNHFFNLSFQVIKDKGTYVDIHHLFNRFGIKYNNTHSNIDYIELQVNPPFLYLVNDLVKDFSTFELEEFCSIKGKYAKDLYRLLKQYKMTGQAIFKWDEFKRLMCIPDTYRSINIEQRILKPAVKELTRELDLIDKACNRSAFTTLEYIKIKDEKARGKPIKLIKFIFTKEAPKQIPNEKKEQWRLEHNQNQKQQNQTKEDRARAYANRDELEVPEYMQDIIPDDEWY